ncbi:GNAT family N-acetyltransferase [Paenibacillus sp. UNC451MF]|uniref:GNAT family N-acetyltransferase n=1 Tax=Paenibacillus sp. UNC451MF TaxID=1449063 RepID=UPI00048FFE39|nr:GNAT family N-acetyltransferase [Paenibacillus sp. UNC451MF]
MKIRKAVLSDVPGIAKVHVDSWRTTYTNIIPDDYIQKLSYEKREQLWNGVIPKGNVFVAENDAGKIVGFSDGGAERSGKYKEFDGELNSIYILQEYQGLGIGTLLVKSVVNELKKLGMKSMIVIVLENNSSRLFYDRLGGKKIDTLEIEFAGKKLKELVYGWKDIHTLFP